MRARAAPLLACMLASLAQSFEAEPVARAIKSRRFATPFGDLAFDENGDLTAESEDCVWYRWHDGLVQMVE